MSLKAAKYYRAFVCDLKTISEYGLDFILKLIRQPVKILLLVLLWKTIFSLTGSDSIAGLNEGSFVSYILIASVLGFSFHPWTIYGVIDEHIKKGKLSLVLTRPVSHMPLVFAKSLKDPLVDLIFPVPFVILAFLLNPFGLQLVIPSLSYFALFLVSFLLSLFLGFLVYYTISICMFWTGDLWSIWGTIDSLQLLLSGQVIPLTISPVLNFFAGVLPFRHMVFTPAYIFIEKFSLGDALMNIGFQCLWIVGLIVISRYILKMGLRKFDSQGG